MFWVNTKHFFVVSPKKKITFSCESRQARTSQLFYSGCYTEKNSLITQRYVAIPQDEWPFVFMLFWVQRESVWLFHVIFSHFCLFVFVYVSTLLLIPAQTRAIRITGHCLKSYCTSCPSFPIQPKLTTTTKKSCSSYLCLTSKSLTQILNHCWEFLKFYSVAEITLKNLNSFSKFVFWPQGSTGHSHCFEVILTP